MNPKFCTHCGTPLSAGAKFCGECGQAVQAAVAAAAPSAAPAEQPAEPILGLVPLVQRRKGFLGLKFETFSLVITSKRLLFPLVTNQMTKELIAQARQEAKSQGKGFLGQAAAQMGWVDRLSRRYGAMSAEDILNQPAGGFAIPSADVTAVRLDEEYDEDTGTEVKLGIKTTQGRYDFLVKGMSAKQARTILQAALGSKVR